MASLQGTTVNGNLNTIGNSTSRSTLPAMSAVAYSWNDPVMSYNWTKVANLTGSDAHATLLITTKTDVNYIPYSIFLLSLSTWNSSTLSVKLDCLSSYDVNFTVRIDNSNDVWIQSQAQWTSYLSWRVISSLGTPTLYYSSFVQTITTPANSVAILPGQSVRCNQGAASSATVTNTNDHIFGGITSRGNINGNLVGNVTGTASGNLTSASSLTAGNLTGTIPSTVLGNSTVYIGTTGIALNRASASQSLTGVNIDGSSASCTGNAATATNASNVSLTNLNTQQVSVALTAGSWYTIAANAGDRASAKFTITDSTSGLHQAVHFYASAHFGNANGAKITVVSNTYYSGPPFGNIRIMTGGTYDGAMVQVYINYNCTINVSIYDNQQVGGWIIKSGFVSTTNPGTVNAFANLTTNSAQVDLNSGKSFSVTNDIYIGVGTTQYKVLHANNYTDYTVTKIGAGASGSWGINITGSSASCTGNAATATALTSMNISQFTNNSGYLTSAVTSAIAGTGISVNASTGAVTITNSSPNATHTGDVTGATALTIANDAVTTAKILNNNVTYAKLQQVAGLSVVGNSTNSTATAANITGSANQVLRVSNDGTALAFGQVNLGDGQAVTGTLPVSRGGTGGTTQATARTTGIGATTVGSNLITLADPGAIRFIRINADNTISALTDVDFRTAIGAGTGGGGVTSVTGTAPIASSGGATPAISLNDSGVTYAKIQNVSVTSRVLGRITAGAGVIEELTGANIAQIIGANTITNATNATNATNVTVTSGDTTANWFPVVWHTGSTLKSSTGVQIYANGGYVQANYFNSSDDENAGNITNIIAKFGDNYHRSATAAKVAAFITGQSMNIVGTATNVTGTVAVANGGTGATSFTAGRVLLGNGTTDITTSANLSYNTGTNRLGVGTTTPGYTLDVGGACHASSFPTSSDIRFKKNIQPLTNALQTILSLRGVKYEWNNFIHSERPGYELNTPVIGMIAQEVENVIPEIVGKWVLNENFQDARSLEYQRIIPYLIEAVKELENKNKLLEARILALENK